MKQDCGGGASIESAARRSGVGIRAAVLKAHDEDVENSMLSASSQAIAVVRKGRTGDLSNAATPPPSMVFPAGLPR
jgi:hypothetical protein